AYGGSPGDTGTIGMAPLASLHPNGGRSATARRSICMKAAVRSFYLLATLAVFVDVCLQFYFAAYGAFSKTRIDFALHGANSFVLLIVMLVALLVSILAAATAGLSWGRVIVQLLLPILLVGQIGLFILHDALGGTQQNPLPGVLGLHALNGLLIFGIAFM